MLNTENTALQMIAGAARCPEYGPERITGLMGKLDMNEKGFALLMNVTPLYCPALDQRGRSAQRDGNAADAGF